MAGSASIKSYPGCLYGPASVLTIPTVQPCVLWAPAQHMDQSDLSHGTKCAAEGGVGRQRCLKPINMNSWMAQRRESTDSDDQGSSAGFYIAV